MTKEPTPDMFRRVAGYDLYRALAEQAAGHKIEDAAWTLEARKAAKARFYAYLWGAQTEKPEPIAADISTAESRTLAWYEDSVRQADLSAILGRMINIKIDLQTGKTKQYAIDRLEEAIKLAEAAVDKP